MSMFAIVGVPDAIEMVKNLSGAMEIAFALLRYLLMFMAVIYMIYAILNLYALTTSGSAQTNKMFPSKAQPTIASAWMQLIIAGLLMTTAMTLIPLASSMSAISGDATISYYSIGSYDASTDNITTAVTQLLNRSFAFLGMLAVYRAFSTAWKISNGESDHKMTRVFGFLFFGLLCFNITFVNALIANTIGFDLFGFLFKTT